MLNVLFSILLSSINYSIDDSEANLFVCKDPVLVQPVVVHVGDVTDESAEQFSKDIQAALDAKQPVIPILIDSYGGSAYATFRMIDTLKSVKVPVATICVGKCMSAGAILLAMGTEGLRFSAPNATILIHDVGSSTAGRLRDIKNETAELERMNNRIYKIMARSIGKPENYFIDILQKQGYSDWFLSPEEAKKHNLVNHLRLPKIKVKIKTHMILE